MLYSLLSVGERVLTVADKCPIQPLFNCAGHILTAAHRGFDLSMTIWAFGDLHLAVIVKF